MATLYPVIVIISRMKVKTAFLVERGMHSAKSCSYMASMWARGLDFLSTFIEIEHLWLLSDFLGRMSRVRGHGNNYSRHGKNMELRYMKLWAHPVMQYYFKLFYSDLLRGICIDFSRQTMQNRYPIDLMEDHYSFVLITFLLQLERKFTFVLNIEFDYNHS